MPTRKLSWAHLGIVTAIGLFVLMGGPLTRGASIVDDLKREITARQEKARELAAKKIELQDSITKLDQQERNLVNQIALLESQIAELDIEIKITENQIEETALQIQKLTTEITQRENDIVATKAQISHLMKELYEQDSDNLVYIVFGAQDFSDVFDTIRYTQILEAAVVEELNDLKILREQLLEEKVTQEDKKRELETLQGELLQKQGILENQQDQREYLLNTTRNQETNYAKLLKDIEGQARAIQAEIVELETKLRFAIDPRTLPKDKGILSWPTISGRITQGYGATSQTGFINHAYQFHNGIDIGAIKPGVSGDPIYAAASGTVVGTGNSDAYCRGAAYGKWIAIDHHNGLTTMYAHLATLAVSPGSKIDGGRVIGYMDSTGFSTGTHLHFTAYASQTFVIRKSSVCGPLPYGGSVNPMDYYEL